MGFRLYTNAVSKASRSIASGIFIVGLLLIGFGFIIIALPEVFALLAAVVFFIAGVGCAITAVKILLVLRGSRFSRGDCDDSKVRRENVRIHIEEHIE